MGKRAKLFAVGFLVTPLLLLIVLLVARWMDGYSGTFTASILFPYAGIAMYIKQLVSFDSLGVPTLPVIFLASVQYPIYGLLLGDALVHKRFKSRFLVILVCHCVIGATVLFLCLY